MPPCILWDLPCLFSVHCNPTTAIFKAKSASLVQRLVLKPGLESIYKGHWKLLCWRHTTQHTALLTTFSPIKTLEIWQQRHRSSLFLFSRLYFCLLVQELPRKHPHYCMQGVSEAVLLIGLNTNCRSRCSNKPTFAFSKDPTRELSTIHLGFVNFFSISFIHNALFCCHHTTRHPQHAMSVTTTFTSSGTQVMCSTSFVHHGYVSAVFPCPWNPSWSRKASQPGSPCQNWMVSPATFVCSGVHAPSMRLYNLIAQVYWSEVDSFSRGSLFLLDQASSKPYQHPFDFCNTSTFFSNNQYHRLKYRALQNIWLCTLASAPGYRTSRFLHDIPRKYVVVWVLISSHTLNVIQRICKHEVDLVSNKLSILTSFYSTSSWKSTLHKEQTRCIPVFERDITSLAS